MICLIDLSSFWQDEGIENDISIDVLSQDEEETEVDGR